MIRSTVATVALICLLSPAIARAQEAAVPVVSGTTLDVSAEAEVKTTPDMASVSAGVTSIAPTAEKALRANATKMDGVFKALQAAGVAEKDIQTAGINLSPQYGNNQNGNQPPRIVAYEVNNTVSATIHDLKNAGNIIDAMVASGANEVNAPEFSVTDPDAARDIARREAVEKAQKRAALYATAAGLKIKRIISISEQGNNVGIVRPYPMRAMAMAAADIAPTQVAPGQLTSEVTVYIKYELAP